MPLKRPFTKGISRGVVPRGGGGGVETTFTDDFNRADGTTGNGWSGGAIVSNTLQVTPSYGTPLGADMDMEAVNTSAWLERNNPTLTKETVDPHGGTQVLRIARTATNNPEAAQAILVAKKRYRVSVYGRSDGNAIPRVRDTGTILITGTSSTDWQFLDIPFVAATTEIRIEAGTATGNQYAEFDDMEVVELLDAPVYRTFQFAEGFFGVKITRDANEFADVYLFVDTNNWVRVSNLGNNTFVLRKCVGGTISDALASQTATYVAGAELGIERSGNDFSVYYNNVKIIDSIEIADAAFADAANFGMYSSSETTAFDDVRYSNQGFF